MKPGSRLLVSSAALIFAADLASKWEIQRRFLPGESLPLAPGLAFTYVMNPGAAFSMFATWPAALRIPMFLGVTLAALWAARAYWKSLPQADRLSALALGLVVGGALGNFVDRIRYGEVVDFIEVGVRSVYTWPVFNVADSAVCVGVGLLVYRSFRPYAAQNPGSEAE
jgi:signal peptidase II